MDFQQKLKDLSKQAKIQARQLEEQKRQLKQKIVNEVDFKKIMSDVKPLKIKEHYNPPPPPKVIKLRQHNAEEMNESNRFYISDNGTWLDIPNSFSKNGQGINDIKRLQTGHWEVVADVDLHGYTQEQAQHVLNEFIDFVRQRGVCGEIIHGSGLGSRGYMPVLKSLVRRWLMQHPDVLAYTEPHKGNDGAVRILVKRKLKHDPWAEDK